MMVTFVSQCQKKALNRTRRVLDAFANRIGDNTWQTIITEDGLIAVKTLLRKTATKNTAVSCHWIRSRSRSELVWIVGNRDQFNPEGIVPVNSTEKEISQFMDKNKWQTLSVIQYASAIAGLFHDFGKANNLFQAKLVPNKKTNMFEPYRHEWVSMRLFQIFVGDMDDSQWLNALSQIENTPLPVCFRDGLDGCITKNHPINNMPSFAQLVAWLILTHHKLPLNPSWKENAAPSPTLLDADEWLTGNFDAMWNSPNCKDKDQQALIEQNWTFTKGLPVASAQWRAKACLLASETRAKLPLQDNIKTNWLNEQLFTTHLARLGLMLADHFYSSQGITPEWQNSNYQAYANTDRTSENNPLKQKLDEHLIGVAYHAQKIAKALPRLNASLNSLVINDFLTGNVNKSQKEKFGWQDTAKKLAQTLSKETITQGFFGINMASTGKGKTLANAKIMYAIGREAGRIRFSVALGLRTLTLQTGREYRQKLKLTDEQLAIAVGGIAVKQLFENEQNKGSDTKEQIDQQSVTGSESQNEFIDAELYVDYKGDLKAHSLSKWTQKNERLEKLLIAPVLVSTIDHLMPATEGTKGGKQIAPTLRLLTSDLVLDEPDDFGLEDLPALCRLVHWAGMLGSRVLLSTATLPPALAYALFQAYQAGWAHYAKVNSANWDGRISCAWFDEFNCHGEQYQAFDSFKNAHEKFVQKRINELKAKTEHQRKGAIVAVDGGDSMSFAANLAQVIHSNISKLHQAHQQSHEGKTISIGLVRMANINPLVAVSKEILALDAPPNTAIHYCIYHSRYPLAIRSYLENQLDAVLNRKEPDAIWQHECIQKTINNSDKPHHIFVVLASPVAEVGRDHDYDWAIIEPSSIRSIIQIAGRVLRHRDKIPEQPNILLLCKNYKALAAKYPPPYYERPGFETQNLQLAKHDLLDILNPEQYKQIDAIQRITLPAQFKTKNGKYLNLIELEHKALAQQLFTGDSPANVWWKNSPYWCGEVQRQQRFRNSKKDESYYLWLADEYSQTCWKWKNEQVYPPKFGVGLIDIKNIPSNEIQLGVCIRFWFDLSAQSIYSALAKDFHIELKDVSMRFGEVRITEYDSNQQQDYCYHPNLGIYQDIGN
ncbi:MAG: type CRISPR-associated helicase Cas3 [Pseudomonadota bacterium]|jgi:CRISPR-associated endonuclease/helicase Cas3